MGCVLCVVLWCPLPVVCCLVTVVCLLVAGWNSLRSTCVGVSRWLRRLAAVYGCSLIVVCCVLFVDWRVLAVN